MNEKLFLYMSKEHGLNLLETDLKEIMNIVMPPAIPCSMNDCISQIELDFGMELTGLDREQVMKLHRIWMAEKKRLKNYLELLNQLV